MILKLFFLKSAIPSILYWIIVLVIYIIYRIAKARYYKQEKIIKQNIEIFKSKSNRIEIDYTDLKIYSNSWMQQIEVGSGTNSRNEYIEINANTIKLKKTINNIAFDIECDIDMKADILKMKLALQNKINLYYDLYDPTENYLDLEFLSDNYSQQQA